MTNIYEAYQQYLSDIGEYVPSVDDVYSGVPRLASTIQNAGITGITGIKDALLPSGDDGNQGPPGPPGPGGVGDLFGKYNNASFLERGLVNTGIGMFAPQLAPLLGMYNIGKGIYDIGRNVLGYNDPALSGYDQLDNPYGFNDGGVDTFGGNTVGTTFGDVRGPDEDESPNDAAGDYGGGSEVGPGDDNDPGYDSGDDE